MTLTTVLYVLAAAVSVVNLTVATAVTYSRTREGEQQP